MTPNNVNNDITQLIEEKHKLAKLLEICDLNENMIISKGESELFKNRIEELKDNEDRISSIMSNVDVGILLQGPDAEIILSNIKAFELLGLTENQLLGKTSFDPSWNVIHEDGSVYSGETHPVPTAIATKKAVRRAIMGVYRPVTRDRVWLLVSAIPILYDNGEVKHVVCSFIDISERKRIEEKYKKSNKKLSVLYEIYKKTTEDFNVSSLLKSAIMIIKEAFGVDGIAIHIYDDKTNTLNLSATSGFSKEFINKFKVLNNGEGLAGKAIISGKLQIATNSDYPEGAFKEFLMKEGFISMASIPLIMSNSVVGSISTASKKITTFDDEELQLLYAISRQLGSAIQNAQLFDSLKSELEERKKAQEGMNQAVAEAVAANRSKSEFLANMSHEIRTPLNAVIGFSELLATMVVGEDQKSYTDAINVSGKNLLILINDILDLSKIEAGKIEIKLASVNIRDIINEIVIIFNEKIISKNLKLFIEIDEKLSDELLLDEVRVRQVLLNLVGNAVKFTESGYVKISVNKGIIDTTVQNKVALVIEVADTGIGIPESDKEIIFEAFRQQRGHNTKKYGGTGLGLTITKRLVEMMNGEINIKSSEKKGSIFTVILNNIEVI